MELKDSFRRAVADLPAPVSSLDYFAGEKRSYLAAIDEVLLFSRESVAQLRRRSAESHLHKRFVLVVCLETGGTMSVDGIPFVLHPGEGQLVFPQSYHHFTELAQTRLLWLFLTFECSEPEKLVSLRQEKLTLGSDDFEVLENVVNLFTGKASELKATRGDQMSGLLSHLLCDWCYRLNTGQGKKASISRAPSAGLWPRFTQQLEALAPEDLRVAPLAKGLGLSERHLRTKFQLQFGVSIGTYLRNYRMRRAVGLMTSSELTLAEIADRCGYRSLSSFCRAFQKQIGEPPAKFRESH